MKHGFDVIGLCIVLASFCLPANAEVPAQGCFIATSEPGEVMIVRAVCEGNQARLEHGEAKAREAEARDLLRLAPAGSDERFRLLKRWKVANDDLADAQNRMSGSFQRAIALTAIHYSLAPSLGNGRITGGPGKDESRDVEWTPRYRGRSERGADFVEAIVLPDKTVHFRVKGEADEKKRPGGMTWPNGRTDIYDETFDKVLAVGSPRQLAFILNHESVHFDQLRGNRWATMNVREVEAYRESRKAAVRFGMTEDERSDIDAKFQENIRAVQAQTRRPWTRPRNVPMAEEERQNAEAWNTVADKAALIRASQAELAVELKREIEDRRLRESVAARERERLEDGRRLFASLEAFSRRFCESAVEGVVPESMHMDFLVWRNGNYLAFSTEQPMIDLGELGFSAKCPAFFENQILVARRKRYSHNVVTFAWAAQVVGEAYRRSHLAVSVPPSSRPTLPPAPEPPNPDAGGPPDTDIPGTPSVPHCRYHAWCQDKTPPPQDN